ncbi:fumarylacetoacetate hydrolase family protein [Arthrobacter sp. zg-ZUI100]|uniref:fumarylacetoacetate hydrolase family protein n=1 Tax=Arthrobacter jiangjiafuii TaxID=2817475 RepID=UPI001AED399C|nr:fumarylacetoacetate hydrolase family protein [Arthrobacter jiangjiafuii]MBP3035222.1 fumarylacetoacetate hydrolase family protein [Arthrobacter jiangjiafuii]
MAYANYELNGLHLIGEVDGDYLVPLAGLTEIGADTTTAVLAAAERRTAERVPVADVRLRAVSPSAGKIICVGLNYRAHIEESNRDLPAYPVMFPKYASNLIGPMDDIVLPPESVQVDYEGELAVIIGKGGRRIAEEEAADHVLGYAVCNDVTMRDYQYKTHQWMQGKAWDASTPIGPYVVTPESLNLTAAGITTTLNGQVVQKSDLSHLIFSIPTLIATVSQFTALQPGDVILTGTPSGVGYRRDPQLFLHDGDTVTVEIEGVGTITNKVTAEQI